VFVRGTPLQQQKQKKRSAAGLHPHIIQIIHPPGAFMTVRKKILSFVWVIWTIKMIEW
jgi:hypothetical protein